MILTKEHQSLAVLVAIGAIAIYFAGGYAAKKAGEAAAKAGNAINPINNDNVFNRGFESVGQYITGDKNWTLGGSIYDWLHEDEMMSTEAGGVRHGAY